MRHFGVIAASQICSMSRKYCAILRNRFFYFLDSIKLFQKTDLEILMDLHVLKVTESKNVIFGMSSVSVCLSVEPITKYN